MSLISIFLVLSLASTRISLLFVREDGPFDMFGRLRDYVGVQYDAMGQPYGETFFAKLLSCIYCTSVWVGVFFTILVVLNVNFALIVALPFALSQVVILIGDRL